MSVDRALFAYRVLVLAIVLGFVVGAVIAGGPR